MISDLNKKPTFWHPEKGDVRSQNLPLVKEFWPTGLITVIYIVGCYYWRKALIQKRIQERLKAAGSNETINKTTSDEKRGFLQSLIVFYNIAMVFYSAAITLGIIYSCLFDGLTLITCSKYEVSWSPLSMRLVYIGYAFYISKFIELLDTFFFLLRGKVDQVTFLHVFHHAAMPPSLWWGVHYAPGGVIVIFPLINSFIHVLMYTYYGLAAMGAYKYLWWKEYLTQAQMIQFAIMIVHQSQVFWPNSRCNDPKAFPAAIMAYSAIFLVLFGNFYVKAYMKKQRLAKKEADFSHAIRESKMVNVSKKHQ